MSTSRITFSAVMAAASLGLAFGASANVLFSQPLYTRPDGTVGGNIRPSQLWVDPTGQNDYDTDSIAWEDFELTQPSTVTQVQWWGEAAPPLGFNIAFYNQDPNTIARQPDIFGPGSGPIDEHTYASPAAQGAAGGLFLFTVDLVTPLNFDANTRYFISIIGLTTVAPDQWGWAQGEGAGTTFYWNRGTTMFYQLSENRALMLNGTVVPAPFTACLALAGLGAMVGRRRG